MKRKLIIKPNVKFARIIMIVFLQFIVLIALTDYAKAQEINPSVISSGGETFTVSGISLEFVIGEIVTESYTNQSVTLTQGFLQETEEELAVNELPNFADDISIYPNPSSDMVYIVNSCLDQPLSIEIIDMQGCIVHSSKFINNPMPVSLGQLNPGLYVFRIMFPSHNFVIRRIIKK